MSNKNCINICGLISNCFNTPYNWSIGVMTFVIWIFTSGIIGYYNHSNFDMLITLHNYIQFLSLGAVVVGLLKGDKEHLILAKYGVFTYLLSVLTLIFTRNIFITMYLAQFILKPASIFCFLMIIKQIWLLTGDSIMSNSNNQKPITNPLLLDSQINLGDQSSKLVEEKKASKPKSKKADKAKTNKEK